jgi:hypothetical protein
LGANGFMRAFGVSKRRFVDAHAAQVGGALRR